MEFFMLACFIVIGLAAALAHHEYENRPQRPDRKDDIREAYRHDD